MRRFLSSVASHKTKLLSKITSKERKILNQTSLGLYRILSRIIKTEAKDNEFILLQPPLNHRDYGQARVVDSTKSLISTSFDAKINPEEKNYDSGMSNKIFSFCKIWAQQVDESEDDEKMKLVGNFDELFGISVDKEDMTDHEDDHDDDHEEIQDETLSPDISLYVSYLDLKQALRQGFTATSDINSSNVTKQQIVDMQRFAIDAISILEDQIRMWHRTSISTDRERGIRVIASSRCIGLSSSGHRGLRSGSEVKHRFAYRIRIENFNEPDNENGKSVQLLGRTWKFQEEQPENFNDDDHEHNEDDIKSKEVNVNAPTTGAVGYLPVIHPGQAFEYMSGCELSTVTGTMSGCFHMAEVEKDTKSAQVGDPIGAFDLPKENHFEMQVLPLQLVVEQFE